MSRNGPIGHSGMRPAVRRPPADDPFTAPPTGQPQAPHWPPPQYPEPQAQHGQQPAYGQPYPQQPVHGQQPAYGQPPGYSPQPAHGQQQPGQGYYFPQAAGEQEPLPNYAPQGAGHQLPFGAPAQAPMPNYGPAPQHAQTVPRRGQQPDPLGYDLGNYMPTGSQGYAPAEPDQFQQGHDLGRLDAPQHGYGETDADFDEMLAEEEEEPRRSRRGLMIAAALVGAIGLGGALAYTYKTFVASNGTRAPLIKATEFGPNKVKPVVQDGKGFAHTDKKLLNRLGEDGSAGAQSGAADAQDDRASEDPNGPRKVKIIPIAPGGPPGMAPPVTTVSAPMRPAGPPMVAVPGVTLENLGPPPSAARVPLPPQAQPPVKAVPVARAAPVGVEPAAPAKRVAVAAPAPVKAPVPKTKAAAAPVVATSATSGYVAVLSSKTSRMDALKAFADLQQKYGDVLSSKTPDVQEANLGDKGVRYRAVVGPPGSRDAASGVCKQLKTAGYNDCWVTAY